MVKFDQIENKSRRQRKKLFLGEFQELGFRITAKFKEPLSAEGVEKACDEFVDYAERHAIAVFACHTPDGFGATLQHEQNYRSIDAQQRLDMVEWVKSQAIVDLGTLVVSELFDVHYATDEDMGL
jgi:uncharacterized protein